MDAAGADEAAVMRDYLISRGVPADRIVADSAGVDTWATARHASAYMREHGYARALAVTQYFHVPRTMLALRRHGVMHVGGAHPAYAEPRDLYSAARAGRRRLLCRSAAIVTHPLNDRALPC